MTAIINIFNIFSILFTLYTGYAQEMCITSKVFSENSIFVVEKSIIKNLNYLKEDIKLPQLSGGIDKNKIESINSVISNDILPKSQEGEKIAKEYFSNLNTEKPNFPYEIRSKYTVSREEKNFLSIYNDYYEFLGGAHGNTIRTSYTIDKNKEELMKVKDLFVSGYDYKNIIDEEIRKIIQKNPENYFDNGAQFKGIDENSNFYISNNDLIMYYQLYEIAPYVAGIPQFKIPMKTFGDNIIYK